MIWCGIQKPGISRVESTPRQNVHFQSHILLLQGSSMTLDLFTKIRNLLKSHLQTDLLYLPTGETGTNDSRVCSLRSLIYRMARRFTWENLGPG